MPESITPEELRAAIEQLRPELPRLLGADYSTFMGKLDLILNAGNETQLLDLFSDYPVVHKQLLAVLDQMGVEDDAVTRGGLGIGDNDPTTQVSIQYWCDKGAHAVAAKNVVERSDAGDAMCPLHHISMVVVQ